MIHAGARLMSPNPMISAGLSDLSSAKSAMSAQTGTVINGSLEGQRLTQGVYTINGNALLDGNLILLGDTSSIFIFNVNGDLIFDSALVYGFHKILPSKVFWNVSGKVTLLRYNTVIGMILSTGKIEVGGLYDGYCGLLSLDSINISNAGSSSLRKTLITSTYYSQNLINKTAKITYDDSSCPTPDYSCNLIANPSFEDLRNLGNGVYCPDLNGELYYACYWEGDNLPYIDNPTWYSSSDPYYIGNPELFTDNTNCQQQQFSSDFAIPINKYIDQGSSTGQPTHTGSDYAGIEVSFRHTYDSQSDIGTHTGDPAYYIDVHDDERLEKKLPTALTPNVVYYMEFYTALADKSNLTTKLSVYPAYTSTNPNYIGPPVYDPSPVPFFTSATNIPVGPNWTMVSGCVSTPNSNVEWVSIRADYASPRVPVTPSDPSIYTPYPYTGGQEALYNMAYFFIDDVLLRPLSDAGQDVTIHCIKNTTIGEVGCQPIAGAVYAWSAADAFTSANSVIASPSTISTPVTFNATGQYVFNLTVTYNGCSSTDQVVVNAILQPQAAISSVTSSCPNPQTTLTASGGSHGAVYSWAPGNQQGTTITVSPASPTIYTVTINDGGCASTATILVNPVFCCTQGTEIIQTSTSAATFPPGVYSLNHALTFNADINMSNVTIFMGTNAELIVANNVRLNMVNNVHLLGCPNMWKGIRAIGPNATITTRKNVMIEDAITAIDVKLVTTPKTGQNNILDISDAIFNKNYTGIDAENYTSSTADYPSFIANTVFTCRKMITPEHSNYLGQGPVTFNWPTQGSADLKNTSYNPIGGLIQLGLLVSVSNEFTPASGTLYPSTYLSQPYANNYSRQGIYLNGVGYTNAAGSVYKGFTLNAGTTYNTLNLFDNMIYGIYATNSNVKSANAAYQEMNQYSTLPANTKLPVYFGGVGIYSENTNTALINNSPNKLTVLPGNTPATYDRSGNFFFNNPYGIKTANVSYVDVEYAMIHSSRVYPPTSFPLGNAALKGDYGIFMKTSDYRDIEVKNNIGANLTNAIIFQADYKPFFNAQLQYVGTVNINSNLLEANYGNTQGTTALNNGIVADNLINCSACGSYQGSPANPVNVNANTLKNVFRGIKSSNWQKQAVSASSNTVTLANETASPASTQIGISHQNNYGDNIISNTVTGFGTTKTTVTAINSQDNKAQTNACNSTASTYEGFTFAGSQNLTNWRNNNMQSHVHGMHLKNTVIGQQGAVNNPMGNAWQLVGNGWSGGYFQTYVTSGAPATSANNSKLYVSNGVTTKPTNNSALIGGTQYNVGTTILTTTGFSHYICSSTAPVNGGVFSSIAPLLTPEFTNALVQIVTDSVPYVNYVPSLRQNGKRAVYRLLTQEPGIAAGIPALQNFRSANAGSNMNTLETVESNLFNGNHTAAQSANSSVAPQDNVETNAKTFYDLYLKSRYGTYNDLDDSTLLMLANGCPDRDGLVVYQSRVLYNSVHEIFKNFEDNCNIPNAQRVGNTESVSSIRDEYNPIQVYPNPSAGSFVINLAEAHLNNMTLKVYDINGRLVYAQDVEDVTGDLYKLDVDARSGVYLLELSDQTTGTQYRQKLIINK